MTLPPRRAAHRAQPFWCAVRRSVGPL